jgi:PAS domain S-box-containing protein
MIDETFKDLKRRAVEQLKNRENKSVPGTDAYQLIEELNLYQVELEIQNEDLIKSQLDLQIANKKYQDLYNLAPIPYFTFNKDNLIIDVNQAGLDLLGMKKEMLINRCFSRYIMREYQALFSQYRQRALKEDITQSCELKLLRWAGATFDAKLQFKAIHEAYSEQKQLLVCITDITLLKEYETAMHLQQVKMASIDRMRSMNEQIYAMTQSQNQAITVIDNYIHGCIRRLESEDYSKDDLIQALTKVAQQSRVIGDIIQQTKKYVSKTVFRYERVDLNAVIMDTLPLIHYEALEFPITVHYEPNQSLPAIKADRLHIQQAILHLARNSIEAMKDANISEPKLLIETRLVNQDVLELIMLDNGPGFDKSVGQKLFDPFFTTKPYAVGLGLSLSRTIVEKHGGELIAQSNTATGAHFKLTLPCAKAALN